MSTETPRADAAAAAVGAVDLFVLRRVSGDQFVHFGGSGRGAGWAGIVEVAASESDALSASLVSRSPTRLVHEGKAVVFGPYYANAAAFVPVTNDVVVVFGFEAPRAPRPPTRRSTPRRRWPHRGGERRDREAARRRARGTRGGSGGARVETEDVGGAMRTLGRVAAEMLSCELAAVYLAEGGRIELADRGWTPQARPDSVAAALKGVLDDGTLPVLRAGRGRVPLPSPLDEEAGVRSYYLLELQGLARGVLFVAHTDRRLAASRCSAAGSGSGSPTSCRLSSASRSRGSGPATRGLGWKPSSPARRLLGELLPVPFGDDVDGAVDDSDRGLVVDRVGRARPARPPSAPRRPSCCPAGRGCRGAGRSRSRRCPGFVVAAGEFQLTKSSPMRGVITMLPPLTPDPDGLVSAGKRSGRPDSRIQWHR